MPTLTWTGHYLSGLTADRVEVNVVITSTGLRLTFEDGQTAWWPYQELKQTQGSHAGEHVRLERGEEPTEALVIPNREFLEALDAVRPATGHAMQPHGLQPRTIALLVVGAVVAVLAYFGLMPVLARAGAEKVPVSWERQLGDMVAEQLTLGRRTCDDPALTAAVTDLTARLTAVLPTQEYTFDVSVVDDDVVNAFAAPGGRVVIFSGLLEKTETPEELAGVLAHEIEHVAQRHGTQAVLRQIPLQVFASLMGGEMMGAREAAQAISTLGALRYGRRAESEADREGLKLMAAAGIDPQGMIRFFETLQEESPDVPRGLTYLSTHPRTETRIARLRELAAEISAETEPLDSARWAATRHRCNNPKES